MAPQQEQHNYRSSSLGLATRQNFMEQQHGDDSGSSNNGSSSNSNDPRSDIDTTFQPSPPQGRQQQQPQQQQQQQQELVVAAADPDSDEIQSSISNSTTVSELVRQLRGQMHNPEAFARVAERYLATRHDYQEDDQEEYYQDEYNNYNEMSPNGIAQINYYNNQNHGNGDDDHTAVSSISRLSAITDVILLSDPELGGGRILALTPPQPDEDDASLLGLAARPPVRRQQQQQQQQKQVLLPACLVTMMEPEDAIKMKRYEDQDPSFDTICLKEGGGTAAATKSPTDGVMKICRTRSCDKTVGVHVDDYDDYDDDDPSIFKTATKTTKYRPRWCRIITILCLTLFMAGGVAVYLPNFMPPSSHDENNNSNKNIIDKKDPLPRNNTNNAREPMVVSPKDEGVDGVLTVPPTASVAPTPTTTNLYQPYYGTSSPSTSPNVINTAWPTVNTAAPSAAPSTAVPTVAPTGIPTVAPTTRQESILNALLTAVSSTNNGGGDDNDNGNLLMARIAIAGSPQQEAFQFLMDTTIFSIHTPTRIVQRYALAVLYHATNGDGWERNDNWLQDEDECLWYNDTEGRPSATNNCDAQGNLIQLRLARNNLMGELPDELGLLTELTELQLGGNDLMGQIPATLGQLPKIKKLELAWTQLDGPIPAQLGQAVTLERINLVGSLVSGAIPPELGNLINLDELLLAQTELFGAMPDTVCELDVPEVWADCDSLNCPCCNYCCYSRTVAYCEYV